MDHDNLRAAFGWAKESGKDEAALRLVCALFLFWWLRGYPYEAREHLAVALVLPSANEPRLAHLRAKVLFGASRTARAQSDYAVANPSASESLALYKLLGDKPGLADALLEVGLGAWEQGNYASAHSSLVEYLAIWKELGKKRGIANALRYLGITERELGNYAEGRRLLEESVRMHQELGFKRGIAQSLMHLGSTAIAQEDPTASSILEASVEMLRQLGDKHDVGRCLHDLGQAAAWQGDYKLARAYFEESATLLQELGDRRNLVKCVEGLARIAVAHRQMDRAARLFGASEAVREKLGTPLPASYRANYERTIAALTAQVDEEQMEKWWAEGRAMTFEQAIEYALENPDPTVIASEAKQSPTRDVEIASGKNHPRNDTRQI
jgi:tetratricopeptide (TPR) repeat protein